MSSSLRTLVLHATYGTRMSYYDDWLDAFEVAPEFETTTLNICERGAAGVLRRTISEFDLVVLLHSTNGDWLFKLEALADVLTERRGRLLSFIGNEVNLPGVPMGAKIALLARLQPELIATQLLEEAGEYLYREACPESTIVSVPHALNPLAFQPGPPIERRSIDIGVRTAKYPPYLGDNDRNRLLEVFADDRLGLVVDISTTERFDRAGWARFLASSKGTVANEAGSWFLERDDRLVTDVREWVLRKESRGAFVIRTDSPLKRVAMALPGWARQWIRKRLHSGLIKVEVGVNDTLDFDEVYERFFRDRRRCPAYSKCISSRHFDAIGTKTCQIMIRGRYNDILVADDHYLALEPDFSNLDEVLDRFRDPAERNRVAESALATVLDGHTYQHRATALAGLMT